MKFKMCFTIIAFIIFVIIKKNLHPIVCWVSRLKRKQEVKSLMLSTHLGKEEEAGQNCHYGADENGLIHTSHAQMAGQGQGPHEERRAGTWNLV